MKKVYTYLFAVYRRPRRCIPHLSRGKLPRPERERADPAAGRLTAAPARYTAPWPLYTASGGADDDLGRRTSALSLQTRRMEATGVTGDRLELLLGHPSHLGFMGLNMMIFLFLFL
jgi:hypothetical protein